MIKSHEHHVSHLALISIRHRTDGVSDEQLYEHSLIFHLCTQTALSRKPSGAPYSSLVYDQ